ncbi:hypothetical protein BIV57_18825 [Mangrovactinospora gilvigrisea]|uniref:DUF4192 domain-containing protein n=1 Tax=Mangrovactinospora gilvigrisea TaxID=1428644 RepID=A0A1J7BBH0_9ACTN|nr:DUF4192 domain-containing protein [Mangrovactinospora gilvigrisea]OIV35974.1 hypothetical protein BIV57_18825 [Mangrovactinospora gilvigrisea]
MTESPTTPLSPELLGTPVVTMRSPADLVDALPYLLGYFPSESVVLVALHGPAKRVGGRLRADLAPDETDWRALAPQLAEQLAVAGGARGERPEEVLVYLCGASAEAGAEPEAPEPAAERERLARYAPGLRAALARHGIPVLDVLVVAGGRWWSLGCAEPGCCPPEGTPAGRSGTPPIAAAAAVAGVTVRGTLKELDDELRPIGFLAAEAQRRALDRAAFDAVRQIVGAAAPPGSAPGAASTRRRAEAGVEAAPAVPESAGAAAYRGRSVRLLRERLAALRADGVRRPADIRLDDAGAARLIIGLQDRATRDRAAEWTREEEMVAAEPLWHHLARRCVAPYTDYACAPLALLGWSRWVLGDEVGARVALARALRLDPRYHFAALLHQALNLGLGPRPLLDSLSRQRAAHDREDRQRAAHDREDGEREEGEREDGDR